MDSTRKKLIFFVNSDPATDVKNIEQAYHFAMISAQSGLKAEVRLAGDAVKLPLPKAIADTTSGQQVRQKIALRDT
ncbi:MAG: hypothetical protein R3264_14505, partial [Anaerolineae bacterium]|nr:hypothetical protein [Anaerolineae bacterium]